VPPGWLEHPLAV